MEWILAGGRVVGGVVEWVLVVGLGGIVNSKSSPEESFTKITPELSHTSFT